MTTEHDRGLDSRLHHAADELRTIIGQHYPDAQFRVGPSSEDPAIVHLTAIVDVDEPDRVLDVVVDRQMELQIEEGLPIFVVTERLPERSALML